MSVRLTVQFTIGAGKADEFEAMMRGGTAGVKAGDPGCEMYDLFKSVDDDTRYVLIESWATQADLDAHGTSEAMKGMAGIRDFLDGKTVMHRYEDEE